jgi:hypothetical protein
MVSDADFTAGRDRQLTRHHDLLAARHTRRHHHVVALALTERDRPELDGLIRLDDVDERPLLTDLRRLTRDQHRRRRGENQLDVDELTRPEMAIGVPNRRAKVDRAGPGLHGVVQERHRAHARTRVGVRRQSHPRLKCAAGHLCLHLREVALGDGEVRVDGIDPLDHQQRRRVRLHDVPDVDQTSAGPTVDRRMDVAIVEIELRVLERRLRSLNLCLVDRDGVSLRLEVELGDRPFIGDRRIHLQLRGGKIERGPGLRELGFRGIELRLIRSRIDREEQLPFRELRAVLEVPLHDASRHLRRDRDRLERAIAADLIEIRRHRARGCGRRRHKRRHGRWRRRVCVLAIARRGRRKRAQHTEGSDSSEPAQTISPWCHCVTASFAVLCRPMHRARQHRDRPSLRT